MDGNNFNQNYQSQPQPAYGQQPFGNGESKYDGGVFETFVAFLAASLMISFTCGIATPWAVCYLYKFILTHIIIDGRRLTFDGTGTQLFGNWIKWFLLMIITCGIYGFWVYPRLFDWIAKHTHMATY